MRYPDGCLRIGLIATRGSLPTWQTVLQGQEPYHDDAWAARPVNPLYHPCIYLFVALMAYYTRSKAVLEYKAAGVLPFAIQGSQVVVLLGAEKTRTGPKGKYLKFLWRDFGGAREAADADSAATAAREFAEETLGLFQACSVDQHAVEACAAVVAARLRDPLKAMRVVHKLKKGEYHMYLTQTCFISPLMFRLATQQNGATGAVPGGEKSAFAWVPLTDLLHSVYVPRRSYRLTCKSAVCGGRGTPPPASRGQREFPLHPCFANSLRLAQEAGLSDLLSRAEALPLPPAPPILLPPEAAAAALAGVGTAGQQPQHVGSLIKAGAGRERGRPGRNAVRVGMDSVGIGQPLDPRSGDAGAVSCEELDSESSDHSAVHGPTPDHMTYWLSQEVIAVELRGQGLLAAGTPATAGATGAQSSNRAAVQADVGEGHSAALVVAASVVLLPAEPSTSHASCTEAGREHAGYAGSADAAGLASEAEGSVAGGGGPGSITAAAAASQAIALAVAAAAGQVLGGVQGRRKKRTRSRKQRQQLRERRRRQQQQQQQQTEVQPAQQPALQQAEAGTVEAGGIEPQDADSRMVAMHEGAMIASDMVLAASEAGALQQPESLIPPPPPPSPPPMPTGSHAWEVAHARLAGLLGMHTSPRKRIKID